MYQIKVRSYQGPYFMLSSYPWVPGALSLGAERQRREADHSPQYSVKINNAWSYTFTLQYVFLAWCLFKHRDQFTCTIFLNVFYCGTKFIVWDHKGM